MVEDTPIGLHSLNDLAQEIHEWARLKGFYNREILSPNDGRFHIENPSLPAEKLLLIVSEVTEALSALRDEDVSSEAEEIADTFIRLLDYCAWREFDIEYHIAKKMEFNRSRPHLHGRSF